MGYRCAGFYSCDRLDNAGIPSTDRIIPELQKLEVGDLLPTSPGGGFRVMDIQLEKCLVLFINGRCQQISGTIMLLPLGEANP